MDPINHVLALIGYVVVGGGGLSLIVYQVFKHLGSKWLDARFDERLQDLKHEQAQEIERLRYKISTLLDRATKLHQREFEVLPEAWAKLNKAFWKASAVVSPFKETPDLNRMGDTHREEFIAKSRLQDWQKDEVRNSEDRTAKYEEMEFLHVLADAKGACTESSRYLGMQGIFVEPELRKKMDRLNSLIWNALMEAQTNTQIQMRERDQAGALRDEGERIRDELQTAIQHRIWPASNVER
ncbi:MAG TPA: hypothetical protein VGI65_05630 [Steroidobacteraceae bacterium]|jgi:hypothetical protein